MPLSEDVESGSVIPLSGPTLVTQPGAVKLTWRGRVLHTFAGPSMLTDLESLRAQLDDLLGGKIDREVNLRPWWKFW